jgi:hypothetical protein
MRIKYIVGLLLITLAMIAAILLVKHHSSEQAEAYKNLLAGNVGLTSVSFEGGGKLVKIDDRSILDDFENAFKNEKKLPNRNGYSFHVVFLLKTGVKIKTDVGIYEDESGFSVYDYSCLNAGDPTYVDVEFQEKINKKTQDLLESLLPKKAVN